MTITVSQEVKEEIEALAALTGRGAVARRRRVALGGAHGRPADWVYPEIVMVLPTA